MDQHISLITLQTFLILEVDITFQMKKMVEIYLLDRIKFSCLQTTYLMEEED
jgi:hypothetical protein